MLEIILSFIMVILFFLIMYFVQNFFPLKFASLAFAFLEMVTMLGILYVSEMGGTITGILKINFYSMALIGFGLLVISLFTNSIEISVWESEQEEKSDPNKWDMETRW